MDGTHLTEAAERISESIREYGEKWFWKQNEKRVGVLSLSARNDDMLMWAHYADGHRGLCLELTMPVNNDLHRITYSKTRPVFHFDDLSKQWQNQARFERSIIEILTTKAYDWAYENEWRCIDFGGSGLRPLEESILTGIIFGLKTSDEDQNAVQGWLDQRSVPLTVYRAQEHLTKFGVKIDCQD